MVCVIVSANLLPSVLSGPTSSTEFIIPTVGFFIGPPFRVAPALAFLETIFVMSTLSLEILVVEDDKGSRELLSEMLAMLGHNVLCVSTAEEAIEPITAGQFNVLIADINLPGMSGIALAEKVVKIVPGMKVIFASGYGYLVADKTDFKFTILPKPFDLAQLKHAVNTL
jgi:CheY-like chemotaxis protein